MGLKLITGLALLGVTAGVTAGVTQSNANVKIKDLEKQKLELVTQLENEKSDKQKYYDALVESAQTLEAKNILIENLTSTLNTTQTDLTTATNNLNLKQSELNSKIEELNIANSNVENLQSLLNSSNEDKVLIQEQLDTALQSKATLETEVATLTSERDALQIQINELTDENTTLQNTITLLNQQIEELESQLENNGLVISSIDNFTVADGVITAYTGPSSATKVVIPSSYSLDSEGNVIEGSDITITTLGNNSFKGKSIQSVMIGNNITTFGTGVFQNCSFLSKVVIVNTQLKRLNSSCFNGCISLESIDLSNTALTEISVTSFANSGIKTIIFPSNKFVISSMAFQNCLNLESLDLSIYNCSFLGSGGQFSGCKNLQELILPETNTHWANNETGTGVDRNFYECENLKEFTILCPTLPKNFANMATTYLERIYVPYGCKSVYDECSISTVQGGTVEIIELNEDGTKPALAS